MDTGPETWAQQAVYLGHGVWDTLADDEKSMHPSTKLEQATEWERLELEIQMDDLIKARMVREQGYPNMFGTRIPVNSGWNINKLEELLEDYHDKEVIEGIKFGWPTGRLPTMPDPHKTFKNHQGAIDFPEDLKKYINKEKEKGAIIGPFKKIPFRDRVGISPISTRPKKQSEDRRIIIDLSFPFGHSVNDGMVKGNYLGFQADLKLPRTDDLALRLAQLGPGAYMFKIDLSRYFRQLPLDPADYSMIGYIIDVNSTLTKCYLWG